jgi:hypothetical protein
MVAPQAAPGRFGSLGGTISDLGDALLHVEDSVRKVSNFYLTTKAANEAGVEIMQIQDEAMNDPDIDENLANYKTRIQAATSKSLRIVTDPIAKLELQSRLSTRVSQIELQISREARQAVGRKALTQGEVALAQAREEFFRAASSGEKEQILVRTAEIYAGLAANGVMNANTARAKIASMNDDLREFDLSRRIDMGDPQTALRILEGDHKIQDPQLVQELKDKASKKFESQVEQGKVLRNKLQDASELNAVESLMDEKLTLETLAAKETRGEIRPEFRKVVEENLLSTGRLTEKSDPDVYMDLIEQITRLELFEKAERGEKAGLEKAGLKRADRPEVRVLMRDIVRANTQGDLTIPRMRDMVTMIGPEFQKAENSAKRGLIGKAINAMRGVARQFPVLSPINQAEKIIDITGRILSGEMKSAKEVNEAIRDEAKDQLRASHPSLSLLDELPDAVFDNGLNPIKTGSKAVPAIIFKRDPKTGRIVQQ